jgi:phage/plasmid primase-like uncharacterized protein
MQQIINAMSEFGLSVDCPVADGNIHRCHSNAKDKRNKSGWYLIHAYGEHYYAVFGCWVRDEKRKASTKAMNGDNNGAAKAWRILQEQHAAAELERLDRAKRVVKNYLEKWTQPADPGHDYLINKGVGVYGDLRECNDCLILPVLNIAGEATSYQIIPRSGVRKRFLYQGVVAGGCFPIPGDDSVTVCVCEGYATGATIREATGFKVLVAFNAGNMEAVARYAGQRFSGREVLICADNDHGTEEDRGFNPGLLAAKKIQDSLGLGFVYPTGIKGTDFNDMAAECGLDAVRQVIYDRHTIECMGQDDCYEMDESLIIPSDLALPGLIGQGLDALEGDILQYSLPLVLTVISRAIAGKISINNTWPNVFNIKVGGTSTGKTAVDKKFTMCLDIPKFVSMNEVASGAGIWRIVAENPRGMGLFDEVSSLFIRHNAKGGVDMVAEGKSTSMCDLFSRSGQCFSKGYGDAKNSVEVNFPCVSIIGNATPTIFDAIQLRDFETGLMQRFDFWVYGGEIKPKPLIIGSEYRQKTKTWINELKALMEVQPPGGDTLGALICENVDLEAEKGAFNAIKEYSEYVVSEANKSDSDGQVGFVSRRFDLSLKYALIHHAAVRGAKRIYEPVTAEDIKWGIQVAEMLSNWKVNVLGTKVVSGDFHRDCEIFKSAVFMATKAGRKPTFAYMATRKTALKDWQPKYSESVINVLRKRGEVITKEGKDGVTQYFLPKIGKQGGKK